MKALLLHYCSQHRKDFCTSRHKQSSNLLVQFSRVLSTQSCSKTWFKWSLEDHGRRKWRVSGTIRPFILRPCFLICFIAYHCIWIFCARHEKTHPPVFTCTGSISSEWLDVLTCSAQKVLFLISWVVQGNRMLLGFCPLMYLPLALCIKKYGVVYATIFLNCLALMWKNLSPQNAAPCCGIESGVYLEILFLFEVGIILLQTNFQHSCIYFYVPLYWSNLMV